MVILLERAGTPLNDAGVLQGILLDETMSVKDSKRKWGLENGGHF